MDLRMPGMTGVEATRLITGETPDVGVLVLTMVEDDTSVGHPARGRSRLPLDLLAQGRLNHDIARRLGLSEKTVRNNVSVIFAKLRVADRGAAIVRAREAGLGTSPTA
jgi:DNA-binding NarL/FixJ family response regulator